MLTLAACANPADPKPNAQEDENPAVAAADDAPAAETTSLEPSLRDWDRPGGEIAPDDEILVIERLEESVRTLDGPRANSEGGYAHRRSRGGVGLGGRMSGGGSSAARDKARATKPGYDRNARPGGLDPSIKATEGSLFARRGTDFVGQFPLKHTNVKAEVSGYLASTIVTQSFTNPFTEVIEAVYTFPLPGDGAINDFVMQIGERRIRGIVRPREEAEHIYAEARSRGHTASLMTQERPNIFTQSVANIEVGGAVDIEVTYFQTLGFEDGRYTYYFPMVVGPRYIAGTPDKEAAAGESPTGNPDETPVGGQGTSPDTDRVDDASKITPPLLPEGMRSGHDISLTLDIDAGLAIDPDTLESIFHKVHVEHIDDTRIAVALTDEDAILNRDFVFNWGFDNDETVGGVIAHNSGNGGYFTLMLQPQLDPADKDVTPREVTFLVDVSGSMRGVPMDASKDVIRRSLDTLRPDDKFNIVYFASGNGQVFDEPAPNTPENIEKAKEFLKKTRAGGGTKMLEGLQRALDAEHDPACLQMYVFLTDGMIGGEAEIHRLCKEYSDRARFFAFGIHSSPNRHLIDGIGEHGRGKVHYCYTNRDKQMGKRAAKAFYSMIDSPVLCDIDIDWNGLPVKDVYGDANDLFAGQPIQLTGRYEGSSEGTIYINGRVGANYITIPVHVTLPAREERHECLGAVWARTRISHLEKGLLSNPDDITNLAVEFNLMSKFTSFVAVDESRIVGDGTPLKVMQPVELPEGMDRTGIEGNIVGKPMSISGWGVIVTENKQGGVAVTWVEKDSPADNMGVTIDQLVAAIDGVAVNGIMHLHGLLMQSSGNVRLGLNIPEGEAHNIIEVEMPQP